MYIYIDLCEDFTCEMCGACCRNDWQITLGEDSYQRNKALFNKIGKADEFQKAFIPLNDTHGLGEYAYIAKQPNRSCWFLEENNLCRLHATAGHEHLDNVCQLFPRYPMDTARGVELTLSFSCPAVLRKVSQRVEPLTIIRSEQQPMPMMVDDYVLQVYPSQQARYHPLRYYFEMEQHFIDIMQCRRLSMKERFTFLADVVHTIEALPQNELLGQALNHLCNTNYDFFDSRPDQSVPCSADILLEHFMVNFIFKKPFYLYGLQCTLKIVQNIWQEVEQARRINGATDLASTQAVILEFEFQYSHNRSLFIAGLTADM